MIRELFGKSVLSAALVVSGVAMTTAEGMAQGLGSEFDASAAGEKTLTVWWLGNQEVPGIEDWMAESVKLYQEKYPNVTVKTVLQPVDTYNTLQKTACRGGSGPDIWYNWGGTWSLEMVWAGCIVPNEEVLSSSDLESGSLDRRDKLRRQDVDIPVRIPALPGRLQQGSLQAGRASIRRSRR